MIRKLDKNEIWMIQDEKSLGKNVYGGHAGDNCTKEILDRCEEMSDGRYFCWKTFVCR